MQRPYNAIEDYASETQHIKAVARKIAGKGFWTRWRSLFSPERIRKLKELVPSTAVLPWLSTGSSTNCSCLVHTYIPKSYAPGPYTCSYVALYKKGTRAGPSIPYLSREFFTEFTSHAKVYTGARRSSMNLSCCLLPYSNRMPLLMGTQL